MRNEEQCHTVPSLDLQNVEISSSCPSTQKSYPSQSPAASRDCFAQRFLICYQWRGELLTACQVPRWQIWRKIGPPFSLMEMHFRIVMQFRKAVRDGGAEAVQCSVMPYPSVDLQTVVIRSSCPFTQKRLPGQSPADCLHTNSLLPRWQFIINYLCKAISREDLK